MNNILFNLSPRAKLDITLILVLFAFIALISLIVFIINRYNNKHLSTKIHLSKKHLYVFTTVFIIFVLYSLTLIYPFIWLAINSVKEDLLIRIDSFSIPKVRLWSNYLEVFKEYKIGEMFFNSITTTGGAVILATLTTTCASYVMSKFEFKGRSFLHMVIIISMTIPTLGSLPATYRLMIDTRLFGTYLGLMLMWSGGFGGHYLYMYAYFKGISGSYAESAMIDGASNLQIFLYIMIPLAMPIITTIMILKTLGQWNEYWVPYLFYSNHPTLAVGIQNLKIKADQIGAYGKLFASMIISTVPILIFFIAFQKQITSVTIGGGIKG